MTGWLMVFLIIGCRDKENGCEDCGRLVPPYGVIASAVGGELAFFDLTDLEPIRNGVMPGWATACEILPVGDRLVATDNVAGALAVFSLPDVDRLEHLSIAGTPVDLRVAANSHSAHLITHNARYYRVSFANMQVDTIDTGTHPRRLRLRPGDHWTWIACPGDSTIRVIRELGVFEDFRISFGGPCTDIVFSPDGVFAYCALPASGQLMILNAADGERLDSLSMIGGTVDLSMSENGRFVMAVDSGLGHSRVYDLHEGTYHNLRCGTSAIRARYSEASAAFFVICPLESMVLRVDPTAEPPVVTDSIFVEPIPQCLSFKE